MNALRLMSVFVRIGAMNEMAYRANFWIQTFESLVGIGTALALVAVVFNQTESLGGNFNPPDFAFLRCEFKDINIRGREKASGDIAGQCDFLRLSVFVVGFRLGNKSVIDQAHRWP